MTIKELRAYLKERGIRGYSTMKKAELEVEVQNLNKKIGEPDTKDNLERTPFAVLV